MLAVLTLLITISTIGTGAFYGLIRGWQYLALLLFTFMLLAGLLFILINGTGSLIGGTAYVAGKTSTMTSRNLDKMKEDIDELRSEEETLDDLENEIEEEDEYGIEALRERVKSHVEGEKGAKYDAIEEFRQEIESLATSA